MAEVIVVRDGRPTTKEERKACPLYSGLLAYFPDALRAVANLSAVGNNQHNPGEPMHWARDKSTDHADSAVRHIIEQEPFDEEGVRHRAKAAWRTLALLQTEIEQSTKL